MKLFLFLTGFFLFSSSTISVQAQSVKSVYTSLSDKVCKTLEIAENEGGEYRGLCPGAGGYKLELLEGDLRQSLNVIAPNKKKYELNLWSIVSPQFSALGEKAEWRVTGAGKAAKPTALIVRYNASEDVEHSEKTTSYLVIIKITRDSVCVTDIVKPSATANDEARRLADTSAAKPCKTNE